MASLPALQGINPNSSGGLVGGLAGHTHIEVTKWQQLANILGLCIAMFIGAFASGLIPACIKLNKRRIRAFVAFGTGLLLCTAMAVIIPEGMHSLAEYESAQSALEEQHHYNHHQHPKNIFGTHLPVDDVDHAHDNHKDDDDDEEDEHDHHHHHSGNVVGWSLVSGFLLMFLVDNVKWCGGMHGKHGHSHGGGGVGSNGIPNKHHTSLDMGSGSTSSTGGRSASNSKDGKAGGDIANISKPISSPITSEPLSTLTIGLLVHSLADGIAVGATKSSSTTMTSLDMIVFMAVMMHKLPAAFGLSIVLRGNRTHSSAQIHKELFAFAISAPIGAIATFLVLHEGFLGIGSLSALGVAYCLLFSGGTFLYVATVHAMGEFKSHDGTLTTEQVVAFCVGCLVPLLIMPEHHH